MGLFKKNSSSETAPNTEAIAKRGGSSLARQEFSQTIGGLEKALCKEFPPEDAESWDRTGLLVGEPALPVTKVAVCLDPTVDAVKEAAAAGANVLVTHHPAFLEAPDSFGPGASVAENPGALVWAAITQKVALMDFHTALDVSAKAARALPGMLNLDFKGSFLEPLPTTRKKGYGQICTVKAQDDPMDLAHLAARCTAVFGRAPRVWGAMDTRITNVATALGSAAGLGKLALEQSMDCLICGEIKYHDALACAQAGLNIIELGHDVSELPLVAVLADALLRSGVPEDRLILIDQASNWAYPEAIRM